jgi:hypothetical protein
MATVTIAAVQAAYILMDQRARLRGEGDRAAAPGGR